MAITFQSQQIGFKLTGSAAIRQWIRLVIEREGKQPGSLSFVFTSDAELLKTNIQFLDHDTYTDIITFDYCEGEVVSGDIIISVERVRENAVKFKTDFYTELCRVIIHGVLHLCGYKDKTKKAAALMRQKEDAALALFRREFQTR